MKKTIYTIITVLLLATGAWGAPQPSPLSVGSSGFTIKGGTIFSVKGLVLSPSADVTITNNSINFSGTAVTVGSDQSISRAYTFTSPLSSYVGLVGIQYSAGELNGNTESALQIAYNPLSSGGSYVVSSGSSTGSADSYYVSNSLSGVNLGVVTALPTSPPTVTTQVVSTYDATSATMGGNVTADGGATVTERGVVYSSTDATPTIGETGVTKNANGTGIGTFSKSITGLSGNTTYYVCAYATNAADTNYGTVVSFKTMAAGTWTGNANSSYWTDAGNWSDNQVPTATTDVTIPSSGISYLPMIFSTETAECNNFTSVDGYLEILSSSSSTGSLIVHGTASGKVWSDVYLTAAQWHIVAPSVNGGDISLFVSNGSNGISSKVNGATTTYALADYNENGNAWNSYFTDATSGTFTSGKGYSMRRDDASYVSFYGNLITGIKTVTLTKTGEGWNCIGNPYTSAIGMNSSAGTSSNFLGVNALSSLDPNYACVYVWDPTTSTYKILGNVSYPGRDLGQNLLQSGQGFFVKAASAGASISFTPAMQTHSTGTALKSAEAAWPGFELTASASDVKASTVVAFNSAMTKGLDPTYDAGLLRGSNGLSLYTKLVDNNGVDFAIQCLPENGIDNFVIPVGVDTKAGGEVKFSATTIGLPTSSRVILEDKNTKVYTDLSNGEEYAVTLSANSSGTGRFYIHTSALTTGISNLLPAEDFSLKAYPTDGLIRIEGQVSSSAKAYLFNIGGSALGEFNLQEGTQNSIPASGLATGVYLLKVIDGSKLFNTKVVLY